MIYVSPNMKLTVTTNVSSGTVSVIEKTDVSVAGQGRPLDLPVGDWNEKLVKVGSGSEGFDVSADGKAIWAANSGNGTVSIIDIASKRVTQTLAADQAARTV
jgi:YVTN family beta-propeller protein